jgi:hypothetical protein
MTRPPIVEIDKNHAQLLLTAVELNSIVRVLRFTLDHLEFEYSTRTGFYEHETLELITRLTESLQTKSDSISITLNNKDIYNLRQNIGEVLGGITIKDYESAFGMPEEGLNEFYTVINGFGENKDIWRLDD